MTKKKATLKLKWVRSFIGCPEDMRQTVRGLGFRRMNQVVERAASRRVEYHHVNMEAMLHDHFATYFGDRPGWIARLRMRRRLAAVYRSALSQLMSHDELPGVQRRYAAKMLRAFPFDPRNVARATAWALSLLRRRVPAAPRGGE